MFGGAQVPVAGAAVKAVRVAKGRRGMTFSSASWGFDPQTASGDESVRERMPERMSLRLDAPAHGKKTKAMVLAIGVDPLDALTQGVDGLARFARHALPPRLEAGGLLLSLAPAPREAGWLDGRPFLGGGVRRSPDPRMSGERNDVLARGVARVDHELVGRLAIAAGDVVDHRSR